jgi:hypothetical protein
VTKCRRPRAMVSGAQRAEVFANQQSPPSPMSA